MTEGASAAAGPPLRVCLVGEGFYPEVLGGMEIHTYQLAERLLDLGVACEVLARPLKAETPAVQRVGRITVRHLGVAGQMKGKGAAAAPAMAAFVARYGAWLAKERGRFDVAVALGAKTTALPCLVARAAGGPPFAVLSLSASEFAEPISAASLGKAGLLRLAEAPWRRLRTLTLGGAAAAAIAVSDEVAAGFLELGVPPAKVHRIPMGVDTDRFRPAAGPGERAELRARLGLPADATVLAFVGRLSRAKGLPMLMALWPEVAARHPEVHLALVGGGEGSFDDCEAELRAAAAAPGLAGRVAITGRIDDVPPWLRAADAFVFPSDREGFGLVLLEAMASGLPVVTTAVGAAPEVVRDPGHGRIVPPMDGPAFAAAVLDLLAARAGWPAMGEGARAAVAAGYGMDAVARRYAALLREVAAAASTPAAARGRGKGGEALGRPPLR